MKKLGYGPDKRLAIEVTTRNTPAYRDPAVLLIDQLKEIYIDATLNAIDTAQWYPTVMRKDYTIGRDRQRERARRSRTSNSTKTSSCGSERNYTGYCNPEVDKLIDQQSSESDIDKRTPDRLGDRAPAGRGRRRGRRSSTRSRRPAGSPTSRATR